MRTDDIDHQACYATPVAVTDHEKLVINRFVEGLNEATESTYAVTEWPDDTNQVSKDVDAIATDQQRKRMAIEHTLLQPFSGERYDTNAFLRTVGTLDKKPTLVLDGFDVTLSVEVGAVRPGFAWDSVAPAIERWYLAERDSLPLGSSVHEAAGLPSGFKLYAWKRATLRGGHFFVARRMPPDSLAAVVEKALNDKLPKLVAAGADFHVLVVEVASLATDFGAAAEIIEKLMPQQPNLNHIDQIWAINTVAMEEEDYTPAYLIWPLDQALEHDLAKNDGV